jgi:hypothetical protein
MSSTAFQSITPLTPRINGVSYTAFPLDGDIPSSTPSTYRLTIIAESFKPTLPAGEMVSTDPAGISITLPEGISTQTAFFDYPIDQAIEITMTDNIIVLGGASITSPITPVSGTDFVYDYGVDKYHATLNMKSDITIEVQYLDTE